MLVGFAHMSALAAGSLGVLPPLPLWEQLTHPARMSPHQFCLYQMFPSLWPPLTDPEGSPVLAASLTSPVLELRDLDLGCRVTAAHQMGSSKAAAAAESAVCRWLLSSSSLRLVFLFTLWA